MARIGYVALGFVMGVGATIGFAVLVNATRIGMLQVTPRAPNTPAMVGRKPPGQAEISYDEFDDSSSVRMDSVLLPCVDPDTHRAMFSLSARFNGRGPTDHPALALAISVRSGKESWNKLLDSGEQVLFLIDGERTEINQRRYASDFEVDEAFLEQIVHAKSCRAKSGATEFEFDANAKSAIATFLASSIFVAANPSPNGATEMAMPIGIADGTDDEEAHYVPPRPLTATETAALHKWFEQRRKQRANASPATPPPDR